MFCDCHADDMFEIIIFIFRLISLHSISTQKCLKWSPAERFKFPDEACNHPWLHNVKQHYMSAFLTLPSYELPHLD